MSLRWAADSSYEFRCVSYRNLMTRRNILGALASGLPVLIASRLGIDRAAACFI